MTYAIHVILDVQRNIGIMRALTTKVLQKDDAISMTSFIKSPLMATMDNPVLDA